MYGDVKFDPQTLEQKTGESSSEYSLDIILISFLFALYTQRRMRLSMNTLIRVCFLSMGMLHYALPNVHDKLPTIFQQFFKADFVHCLPIANEIIC